MATIYDRALQFILDGNVDIIDPAIEFVVGDPTANPYRLNTYSINGETTVVFSKPFQNNNYYVTVKRFTASNGTIIEYG
jgi:hypothetical protein